jgi:hypothetical protein
LPLGQLGSSNHEVKPPLTQQKHPHSERAIRRS